MKKLLLASTAALVGSAGVAAADVTLSGDGRMGVVYNSGPGNNFMFTSRARVTFDLSGETDTGLAFGGSFRADNAGGASGGTAGSVFISGDFGRLTMGDTNGAAQFVVGNISGVGLTGLNDYQDRAYLGNPAGPPLSPQRPIARYDITIDGFTVAVSYTNPGSTANDVAAIGVAYQFDGFGAAIGYENVANGGDHWIIGASAEFDGFTLQANYGRIDTTAQVSLGVANRDQYGIGAGFSMDDIGVNAYYSRNFNGQDSFGIGASYDLGGGASLVGGIVRTQTTSPNRTEADFGISFSF